MTAVLLIAASTQVVPALSVPPVSRLTLSDLPNTSFDDRIQENLARVRELVTETAAEHVPVYRSILEQSRQLLQFDPDANQRRGSWAELVGQLSERTETVGILVPGSAAFIHDDNFGKYYQRAADLVEAGDGRLAMVVWADGRFPKGWLRGAMSHYHVRLGRSLALFSQELRAETARVLGPDHEVQLVVAGHSFGGAVVGAAERYGLDADAVLHIASAGMGLVRDPYDYPEPERPRYTMTAPGDLISLVQGLPAPPGLGHGPSPDRFRCAIKLPTGHLPPDRSAVDEHGDDLRERAGRRIDGVSSHSEVFIRYSDAWWQIYGFFSGTVPAPEQCSPPAEPAPADARVLPLAVPRAVTASQCRAGGGLRPAGRHRAPG